MVLGFEGEAMRSKYPLVWRCDQAVAPCPCDLVLSPAFTQTNRLPIEVVSMRVMEGVGLCVVAKVGPLSIRLSVHQSMISPPPYLFWSFIFAMESVKGMK